MFIKSPVTFPTIMRNNCSYGKYSCGWADSLDIIDQTTFSASQLLHIKCCYFKILELFLQYIIKFKSLAVGNYCKCSQQESKFKWLAGGNYCKCSQKESIFQRLAGGNYCKYLQQESKWTGWLMVTTASALTKNPNSRGWLVVTTASAQAGIQIQAAGWW